MNKKLIFSIWLIETLSRGDLSLEEIKERWDAKGFNPLAERTFQRYKSYAENIFGLEIEYNALKNNKYHLEEDVVDENLKKRKEWILSSFRLTNLSSNVDYNKRVLIESAPKATELLSTILEAISKGQTLSFKYKSYLKNTQTDVKMLPVFVKLFKQRWYVVGEFVGHKFDTICALERIKDFKITVGEKSTITPELEDLLNPETYFDYCYSVFRKGKPEKIRIRAFYPENLYIKSVPIHKCQKVIAENEKYTDFEYYLRPTYDLMQEFLWHREKLEVLAPDSLRKEMVKVLEDSLKNYQSNDENSENNKINKKHNNYEEADNKLSERSKRLCGVSIEVEAEKRARDEAGTFATELESFLKGSKTSGSEESRVFSKRDEIESLLNSSFKDTYFYPQKAIDENVGLYNIRELQGAESLIFYDKDDDRMIKLADPYVYTKSISSFLNDRIFLQNLLFPETSYKLEGFTVYDGCLRFILSQPYVDGAYLNKDDLEKVKHYMESLDFKYDKEDGSYKGKYFNMRDVNLRNVLKKDDFFYFIDPIISEVK